MKPDWSKKPERAEVYIEHLAGSGSGWYATDQDMWVNVDNSRAFFYKKQPEDNRIKVHYPPETKTQWRGPEGGFPPVGIEVEVNHHEYGWTPADTVGRYGDYMVCSPNGGGFYGYDLHEIRPKKSDKEKWLDAAGDLLNNMQPLDDFLSLLYDAMILGEIPIPKKEPTNEPTI